MNINTRVSTDSEFVTIEITSPATGCKGTCVYTKANAFRSASPWPMGLTELNRWLRETEEGGIMLNIAERNLNKAIDGRFAILGE